MAYKDKTAIVKEERVRLHYRMGTIQHPDISIRGKDSISWQVDCDPKIPDKAKEVIWMGFLLSEIDTELLLHLSSLVFKTLGVKKDKLKLGE